MAATLVFVGRAQHPPRVGATRLVLAKRTALTERDVALIEHRIPRLFVYQVSNYMILVSIGCRNPGAFLDLVCSSMISYRSGFESVIVY